MVERPRGWWKLCFSSNWSLRGKRKMDKWNLFNTEFKVKAWLFHLKTNLTYLLRNCLYFFQTIMHSLWVWYWRGRDDLQFEGPMQCKQTRSEIRTWNRRWYETVLQRKIHFNHYMGKGPFKQYVTLCGGGDSVTKRPKGEGVICQSVMWKKFELSFYFWACFQTLIRHCFWWN